MVTVNQVISQSRQDLQIWDTNDGVLLQLKYTQLKRLHAMKASTLEVNNDIGGTTTLVETYAKEIITKKFFGQWYLPIIKQSM